MSVRLRGIPLPAAEESATIFAYRPHGLAAYRVCLDFEQHAIKAESEVKTETKAEAMEKYRAVVSVRILGYLLLFAPSQIALAEVATAIHSCNKEYDKILELGDCFLNLFIRAFKKYKTRTPVLSDHSSRSSSEMDRDPIGEPKDHVEAKEIALYRDGFRCIVSGKYDVLGQYFGIDTTNMPIVSTQCAHIVPESTYFFVESGTNEAKAGYVTSVLSVLKSFGYDIENLNGSKVHSLYNVITMQHDVNDYFDSLLLWFEETEIPNQYRPTSPFSTHNLPRPDLVTFSSPDPQRFPVPSRELLALHAVCCKVRRMSGAAEYLDEYDWEMEGLDVLDPNGTSSGVLDHAIRESLGNGWAPRHET